MWPCCTHFPIAGGSDRMVVDLGVLGVQGFENLLIESANILHAKDGSELPSLVVAREGGANRIPLPVLGRAHSCLQNPPSHAGGNLGIQVEPPRRFLDPVECAFRNGNVTAVLKALRVGLLEGGTQSDRRRAADFLGLRVVG
ncbi:MAG: hypothetical protein GEU99_26120 [Luteitalea sp.]|nr:hypothetical protein [Luteitalea sp.]